MGKGSKKSTLFPKSSSRTFTLLHASQRSQPTKQAASDIDDEGNEVLKQGMVLVENVRKRGKNVKVGGMIDEVVREKEREEIERKEDRERRKRMEKEEKTFVNELGLVDDGYDYNQHLRETDGNRVYKRGVGFTESNTDVWGKALEEDGTEVDRHLESVTLTMDGMDVDMKDQLFGDVDFEEGDNALLDDFCEVADMGDLNEDDLRERGYIVEGEGGDDKEEGGNKWGKNDVLEFDYDAHIRDLIQKSEIARGGKVVKVKEGEDFFAGLKAVGQEDDSSDDDDSGYFDDDIEGCFDEDPNFDSPSGVTPPPPPTGVSKAEESEINAVTEAYLLAMEEYDDDEIGGLEYNAGGGGEEWFEEGGLDGSSSDEEGEHEDDKKPSEFDGCLPSGPVPVVEDGVSLLRDVENDTYVDSLLTEYIQDKKDELFMVGTGMRRGGGSGFTALVGGKMRLAEDIEEVEGVEEVAKIDIGEALKEADEILAKPKQKPPEEDVRIDGMSYFDEKTVNPWDCESVLSTYSNLDNRPREIGSRRRKKKKGKELLKMGLEGVEEEFTKIQLSEKTGLPVTKYANEYGDDDDDDDDDEYEDEPVGVNKGEGRKKGESKEEKKARKKRVKEEREMRRREKQENKKGYGEAIEKRTKGKDQVLAGAAVFRYS